MPALKIFLNKIFYSARFTWFINIVPHHTLVNLMKTGVWEATKMPQKKIGAIDLELKAEIDDLYGFIDKNLKEFWELGLSILNLYYKINDLAKRIK